MAEFEDEVYQITPKGIAVISLLQTGLASDIDDPRIDGFWSLFEQSMIRHGYVESVIDGEA